MKTTSYSCDMCGITLLSYIEIEYELNVFCSTRCKSRYFIYRANKGESMNFDNELDWQVLKLIESKFGRKEFVKGVIKCDAIPEGIEEGIWHIQVDLPSTPPDPHRPQKYGLPFSDLYADRWRYSGALQDKAIAVDEGWRRFSEITDRRGQVNLHRVFIAGYDRIPIIPRSG